MTPTCGSLVFQLEDDKNMRADNNCRVGNDDNRLGREIAHGIASGRGGRGVCQHRGKEDQPGMDRKGQTNRAERSRDREESAIECAGGDHAQGGPADRGSRKQRRQEVGGHTAMDSVARERS